MITLQHVDLFYLALYEAHKDDREKRMKEFFKECPFVLLPDGIRAYVGPRQPSHFEKSGETTSWMKFPTEDILRTLTKENAREKVSYELAATRPCVIGEDTVLSSFDKHNIGNPHYHALRIHLLQDIALDGILRERMIDATDRFDDRFVIRCNQQIIDGKELRRQVANFERIGFIKLAGIVYERTGELLDRAWFEKWVYPALCAAYPKDLADNTFRFMKIDDATEERLQKHQFDLTAEDRAEVPMAGEKLDEILDELYVLGYYFSYKEIR